MYFLKEKVIQIFFVFTYSLQVNISAFSLIKVSAAKSAAILKKFVSKEVTLEAAILNCIWQPGRL